MLACRYSLHYFGLEETKCYSTAKKKVPFFLIGCIIQAANTSWETQRDRERENKNLNMWQKKNNFLHFLKFYTHTRTLTHMKILYNALIMISSRTDRTLEETVFWDQRWCSVEVWLQEWNRWNEFSLESYQLQVFSCYCQQRCHSCFCVAFATGLGEPWCHWWLSPGVMASGHTL